MKADSGHLGLPMGYLDNLLAWTWPVSHNPAEYNGFKSHYPLGGKLGAVLPKHAQTATGISGTEM
jgi:hypothetical protein